MELQPYGRYVTVALFLPFPEPANVAQCASFALLNYLFFKERESYA